MCPASSKSTSPSRPYPRHSRCPPTDSDHDGRSTGGRLSRCRVVDRASAPHATAMSHSPRATMPISSVTRCWGPWPPATSVIASRGTSPAREATARGMLSGCPSGARASGVETANCGMSATTSTARRSVPRPTRGAASTSAAATARAASSAGGRAAYAGSARRSPHSPTPTTTGVRGSSLTAGPRRRPPRARPASSPRASSARARSRRCPGAAPDRQPARRRRPPPRQQAAPAARHALVATGFRHTPARSART